MRVLFPFVGDSVGGSHRSVLVLYYSLLKDENIDPIFVLHKKGPLSELLDDLNIRYKYLSIKYLAGESPRALKIIYGILTNFIKIFIFLKKNKINIVHGNDLRINLTWSLPTKLTGVFYVWHQRSLMSSSVLWKVSALMANHFVTISNYVHQSLPKNIPKSKISLVLNPFNTNDIFDRGESREWVNLTYKIPEKAILFGFIGRIIKWKNVDFLIKCFAVYAKESSTLSHLIIVGTGESGYIDTLKALVKDLGVCNLVSFVGFSSNPNKMIASFDFMMASSNNEPFGRTIIEAMVQKTPVLAAYGGGHSESIINEKTGKNYHHNDINGCISQISSYVNEKELRVEIVNNAYKVVSVKYSSNKHYKSIKEIYRHLIAF